MSLPPDPDLGSAPPSPLEPPTKRSTREPFVYSTFRDLTPSTPVVGPRPVVLTVAAVLALITGVLGVLNGFLALDDLARAPFSYSAVLIVSLVLSFVLVIGARKALKGEDLRLLTAVAVVILLLRIVLHLWLTTSLRLQIGWIEIVDYVLLIGMIALCLLPPSRNWVKAKGGTTF